MPHLLLHYADHTEEIEAPDYDTIGRCAKSRREMFHEGDRIRLVALTQNIGGYDDRPNLPIGTEGTVEKHAVDDFGTVWITWDNGHRLGATVTDVIERL